MKALCFSSATILFLLACGSGGETSLSSLENAPGLKVLMTIGEESGDSCYMFGDIRDACVTVDGRLLVLDGITCRINCYSPGGEFIEAAGGSGEGPGEFVRPSAIISLEDGRIAVSDPGMTRMTFLNPDLSVDTIVSCFIPWSPARISPADQGSYTGSYRIFDRENSMYGKLLALWSDSPDQDFEYYRETVPFNRERLRESTEACEIVFTSDYEGNVYYAAYSYTEFRLEALDLHGNTIFTIQEEREPRERPLAEIEEEREEMRVQLLGEGAPPDMEWNPAEYRPMVPLRGMGVDSDGRLWIRDGREETPVFDVYLNGEHLFRTALQDSIADSGNLRVKVTERGILAWSPDPELFPVLHILELE